MLQCRFACHILPVALAILSPKMCPGLHVRLPILIIVPAYNYFVAAFAWWYSLFLLRCLLMLNTTGGKVNFSSADIRLIHEWTLIRMGAWVDLTLMTLTFAFSIIWNVEVGVVVSLIISLLLVVHRSSKTRMTILVSPIFYLRCSQLHLRGYISDPLCLRGGSQELIDGSQSMRIQRQKKASQEH